MKIDHKESIEDFGNQFLVDSNIDDYWGSNEMLKDIVYPFDLKNVENKTIMEVGSGSGRVKLLSPQFSSPQASLPHPISGKEAASPNVAVIENPLRVTVELFCSPQLPCPQVDPDSPQELAIRKYSL